MKKVGWLIFMMGVLCFLSVNTIALASDFPQRPIRMIVPWSAGGGTDVLCRAFQMPLEKAIGQRVIVENIPAGATKVGTMELIKAKPDGYTLIFSSVEGWIGRYYSKTYDSKVWEQMTPIGKVSFEPMAIIEVREESPYKTWADVIKIAKENPDKLSCGNPGAGGPLELIFKDITERAGVKIRYVPFAGSGPSKVALLGGHIDFRLCQPSDAFDMIRAGKSRGLALSTDKRMAMLPNVPTFKELGSGGSHHMSRSIWGPPKMPSNIVTTITKAIEKATKDGEFIKLAQEQKLQIVDYRTPEEMTKEVQNYDQEFGPALAKMYK